MRLLLVVLPGAFALALAACPTPKMPKGPPPEYEDPPPPSWFEAGAAPTTTPDGG